GRAYVYLRVGVAVLCIPGTHLLRVALACRGAALREGRQEAVRRTARARAGAVLDVIARAGCRPAHRARIAGRMLAAVAAAVALVGAARVPVARARRPCRLLRVRRAGGA